jgi:two-component system, OmpR family, sensor kinase
MKDWWLRRSLRASLAVWYAITPTIILLALGGMLLFVVRGRLISQLDHQLREDFETVESSVVRDPAGGLRWPGYAHQEETTGADDQVGLWFEILSPAGAIFMQEGPPSDLPIASSTTHREDAYTAFSAEIQGHLHVRVLENNTEIAGDPVVLRVFRSEAGLRRALTELGVVLAFGLPVAGALSAIGGYFIAQRSLSPVSQIAARARQITADSLEGRLPVPNPHDELGQLATVFNATLGRLENSFAELRRFTADASHELRTPLTALRSVGEAALRSDNEDLKESSRSTFKYARGSAPADRSG